MMRDDNKGDEAMWESGGGGIGERGLGRGNIVTTATPFMRTCGPQQVGARYG